MNTDVVFPQLERCLEPTAVAELFARRVPFECARPRVRRIELDEARHKPGKSCVLSYRLRLDSEAQDRLVCLELLPANVDPPGLTGYIADVHAMVWLFPSDRALTHLEKLFDSEWLERDLRLTVAGLVTEEAPITALRVRPVHYIPLRSCIFRCDFVHGPSPMTLFAKQYADTSGSVAFDVMSQLAEQWSYGAKPLRYDPATATLWQHALPGAPLTVDKVLERDGGAILAEVARCVAKFHSARIRCDRRIDMRSIDRELDATEKAVMALEAAERDRALALLARLRAGGAPCDVPRAECGPLHRDLKLINFLLSGTSVSLIDLDTVALGDPCVDVASLAANVYMAGLRAGSMAPRVESLVDSMIEHYLRHRPLSRADLHWHIAAALLYEVIRRSARQRSPEKLRLVSQLLDVAESRLGAHARAASATARRAATAGCSATPSNS